MRTLIKIYLSLLLDRKLRLMFVGRRLKIQQHHWLHFTQHPDQDDFVKDPEMERPRV